MIARRVLGILTLVIILACAAWLLAGWSNIFGWPSNRELMVIVISPDTELHVANGQVQASYGSYIWSNPHTGQWLANYGLPLCVLVALAMLPVWRLLTKPRR